MMKQESSQAQQQELLPRQKTTADETFHDDGQQHENHLDSNYKSEGNATAADQHSFAAPVHQSTVKFQRSDNSQPWTEMETLLLKRTRFTTHILPPNTVYDSSGCLDRKKVLKQLMWVQTSHGTRKPCVKALKSPNRQPDSAAGPSSVPIDEDREQCGLWSKDYIELGSRLGSHAAFNRESVPDANRAFLYRGIINLLAQLGDKVPDKFRVVPQQDAQVWRRRAEHDANYLSLSTIVVENSYLIRFPLRFRYQEDPREHGELIPLPNEFEKILRGEHDLPFNSPCLVLDLPAVGTAGSPADGISSLQHGTVPSVSCSPTPVVINNSCSSALSLDSHVVGTPPGAFYAVPHLPTESRMGNGLIAMDSGDVQNYVTLVLGYSDQKHQGSHSKRGWGRGTRGKKKAKDLGKGLGDLGVAAGPSSPSSIITATANNDTPADSSVRTSTRKRRLSTRLAPDLYVMMSGLRGEEHGTESVNQQSSMVQDRTQADIVSVNHHQDPVFGHKEDALRSITRIASKVSVHAHCFLVWTTHGLAKAKGYVPADMTKKKPTEDGNAMAEVTNCVQHLCNNPSCLNVLHLWNGNMSFNRRAVNHNVEAHSNVLAMSLNADLCKAAFDLQPRDLTLELAGIV